MSADPKLRMPGYSMPKRTAAHWFIRRKGMGDWFATATGGLFNTITDPYRDPGTRLFVAMRRKDKK